MLQRLVKKVKELNDLMPQIEKLLINLISVIGWIIILIKLLS